MKYLDRQDIPVPPRGPPDPPACCRPRYLAPALPHRIRPSTPGAPGDPG